MTLFGANREFCANLYQENYNVNIHSGQLCAVGAGGRGNCNGDLGVPLMAFNDTDPNETNWYLAGLVSSSSCGLVQGTPEISTRVNYYYDWIVMTLHE